MWARRQADQRPPAGDEGTPSDAALVRAVRAGEQAAFGELVRRYQDRIYTLVVGRTESQEDALDLTQEVFLKAYRRLDAFRENSTFYTWLYRIAVNTHIDFTRRRGARLRPVSIEDAKLTETGFEPADETSSASPERCLLNRELADQLREAMLRLPEPARQVLVLHDVEGLKLEQIAAIVGCPIGTAKSRLHRARLEMQQRLHRYLDRPGSHGSVGAAQAPLPTVPARRDYSPGSASVRAPCPAECRAA